MPRIRQLAPHVVTKIAAGEVIERPASVVKELLENSIDAGSTRIDIELDAGGTDRICVVDDGCGIVPEDLALAFASHATSKLVDADDLFAIATMGFRGEALASIGGVAQVTLQSRTHDQPSGSELTCAGGELSPVKPWNGSPGTRIDARHLFFNVPVRKKFLKSNATELGHVCETVTRLALANPTLHLTLRHNSKLVYDIPASANLQDRIALFFGNDVRESLLEVDSGTGPMRITGFIADPKCDRGNAKLQYLFINGRWFRDRSVAHALQEAYRGLLMTGRYAVGFLFLDLPPDRVDVNVHPTKSEVRFQENSLIYSLVRSTVKNRLLRENLVPRLSVPLGEPDDVAPVLPDGGPEPKSLEPSLFMPMPPRPQPLLDLPPSPFRSDTPSPRQNAAVRTIAPWELPEGSGPKPLVAPTAHAAQPEVQPEPIPASVLEAGLADPLPSPGMALQVHDAYLVLETAEGMLVIDQHALHERILFEQFRNRIREGKLEVQRLLVPEPIDLPAEQAALVLEVADELRELGLDVSDFGGNTILLSSYPTLLDRKPPHEILRSVIDYLLTKERPPTRDALMHHLTATMACKAAVKAGDRLSPEEITYLLRLREFAEDSHHCPHGRPTSLAFTRQELDKQFRRT